MAGHATSRDGALQLCSSYKIAAVAYWLLVFVLATREENCLLVACEEPSCNSFIRGQSERGEVEAERRLAASSPCIICAFFPRTALAYPDPRDDTDWASTTIQSNIYDATDSKFREVRCYTYNEHHSTAARVSGGGEACDRLHSGHEIVHE
ncbi:hypothetical protein EVAR_5445_1 [Eumeta japonica]|uniref:Uncharacterized protein n=1 Tax=Eumeta variegata TaxID=151549 RepID=A0A4C1T9Q9_EUMVA|nr:hypothetical protein EVAR_5445_1 [Eumeta japonica]